MKAYVLILNVVITRSVGHENNFRHRKYFHKRRKEQTQFPSCSEKQFSAVRL